MGWTSGLATAAVAAFFVLSGYVITATTDPSDGWRKFAVLRAARLYSVVVPAWVLSCVAPGVRWAAGYTFSLYLFHRPLQNLAEALLGGRPVSAVEAVSILTGILIGVVVLGSVTEKRKDVWRRLFTALLRTPSHHSGPKPRAVAATP